MSNGQWLGGLPRNRYIEFTAAGFSGLVSGIVYDAQSYVASGMPLGGVDTGCIDVESSGLFGRSTIFNSHVPRGGPLNTPFLGVRVGGVTWVLTTGAGKEYDEPRVAFAQPGSHLLFQLNQYMAHYGRLRGSVLATAPAGSVFVTHYGIWHRRSASTVPRVRNLLKFWYLRTVPPERDWVVGPALELDDAFHAPAGPSFGREMHRTKNDAAELFYWLSGRHDEFLQNVPKHNLPVYFARRAEVVPCA